MALAGAEAGGYAGYEGPERYSSAGERENTTTSSPTSTAPAPSSTAAAPVQPQDPWMRFGDILAGLQAPTIPLPQSEPQTVTYTEGGRSNLMVLFLLLAAAGAAYWWYTKRKGGGS